VLASISAATLAGAVGRPVSVEVHVSNGLPGFTIVGLPDAAVRESRDRVRAALLSSGLPWPLRRVTVNLAPSTFQDGKRRLSTAAGRVEHNACPLLRR
jgi:magnesium chelatase family protein